MCKGKFMEDIAKCEMWEVLFFRYYKNELNKFHTTFLTYYIVQWEKKTTLANGIQLFIFLL